MKPFFQQNRISIYSDALHCLAMGYISKYIRQGRWCEGESDRRYLPYVRKFAERQLACFCKKFTRDNGSKWIPKGTDDHHPSCPCNGLKGQYGITQPNGFSRQSWNAEDYRDLLEKYSHAFWSCDESWRWSLQDRKDESGKPIPVLDCVMERTDGSPYIFTFPNGKRSPITVFFNDLDMGKFDQPPSAEQVLAFWESFRTKVLEPAIMGIIPRDRFGPKSLDHVLLWCCRKVLDERGNPTDKWKLGLHPMYPFLPVVPEESEEIRFLGLEVLVIHRQEDGTVFGLQVPEGDGFWDAGVFRNSGLRLAGSRKVKFNDVTQRFDYESPYTVLSHNLSDPEDVESIRRSVVLLSIVPSFQPYKTGRPFRANDKVFGEKDHNDLVFRQRSIEWCRSNNLKKIGGEAALEWTEEELADYVSRRWGYESVHIKAGNHGTFFGNHTSRHVACPYGRFHDRLGFRLYGFRGKTYFQCLGTDCKNVGHLPISKSDGDSSWVDPPEIMEKTQQPKEKKVKDSDVRLDFPLQKEHPDQTPPSWPGIESRFYSDRTTKPLHKVNGENQRIVHVLRAAKGHGKTHRIVEYSQSLPRDSSILAISIKRAVAVKMGLDVNLELYFDPATGKRKRNLNVSRLSISLQSLWRLHDTTLDRNNVSALDTSNWARFDEIILDEWVSNLACLVRGETHKARLHDTLCFLAWHLYHAKTIIVSDADLEKWHIDLLEQIVAHGERMFGSPTTNRTTKYLYNINLHRHDPAEYIVTHCREMFEALITTITEGQPVACLSTTKEGVKKFEELCRNRVPDLKGVIANDLGPDGQQWPRLIVITGDNSDTKEVQQILSRIDEYLEHCDVFIANSSISTSIDIQSLRFPVIYFYAAQGGCDAREALQLIGRFRHKNKVVCGILPMQKKGLKVKRLDIEREIAANLLQNIHLFSWAGQEVMQNPLRRAMLERFGSSQAFEQLLLPDPILREIFVKDQITRNLSETDFLAYFMVLLLRSADNVFYGSPKLTSPPTSTFASESVERFLTTEYPEAKKKRKADELDMFVNAPRLSRLEYDRLAHQGDAMTNEQRQSTEKFRAETFYNRLVTSENASEMSNYDTRKRYARGRVIFHHPEQGDRADFDQIVHGNLLEKATFAQMRNALERLLVAAGFKDNLADRTTILPASHFKDLAVVDRVKRELPWIQAAFKGVRCPGWKKKCKEGIDVRLMVKQALEFCGAELVSTRDKSHKQMLYRIDTGKLDRIEEDRKLPPVWQTIPERDDSKKRKTDPTEGLDLTDKLSTVLYLSLKAQEEMKS